MKRKFTEFEALIDLIISASFQDHVCGEVDVRRGQVLTSQVRLAVKWRWGRNKVRRFLKICQKRGEIVLQPCPNWSLVTICDYDRYQGRETASKQVTNHPWNTIKNGKNVKKESGVGSGREELANLEYPSELDDHNIQERMRNAEEDE